MYKRRSAFNAAFKLNGTIFSFGIAFVWNDMKWAHKTNLYMHTHMHACIERRIEEKKNKVALRNDKKKQKYENEEILFVFKEKINNKEKK